MPIKFEIYREGKQVTTFSPVAAIAVGPESVPIPGEVVFDLVYNPMETLLLERARAQGRTVIAGLEMFIEQAVRQFEIWTGESAPRAVMQKAAVEALETQK